MPHMQKFAYIHIIYEVIQKVSDLDILILHNPYISETYILYAL